MRVVGLIGRLSDVVESKADEAKNVCQTLFRFLNY